MSGLRERKRKKEREREKDKERRTNLLCSSLVCSLILMVDAREVRHDDLEVSIKLLARVCVRERE